MLILYRIWQDLGLEGTSLNDILYKNAAFLNLVDPISHELLLSLAREMQCPKKVSVPRHDFHGAVPQSGVLGLYYSLHNQQNKAVCLEGNTIHVVHALGDWLEQFTGLIFELRNGGGLNRRDGCNETEKGFYQRLD